MKLKFGKSSEQSILATVWLGKLSTKRLEVEAQDLIVSK